MEPDEQFAMAVEAELARQERHHDDFKDFMWAGAKEAGRQHAEIREVSERRHTEHMAALDMIARQLSRIGDALGASADGRLPSGE
jgi:hypothetical protein